MKALKEREHKVIYKDGDKVVKVFDETFSKADVLNEALNMARVEETGLRIPKLLNVSKVDGKWAITREYIEGTPLSQLMAQHPEKQDEYLNTFVDIQLEILGKTCPHLNKIKDKMHAKISASDYEATLRYDLHNRLEGMKPHKKGAPWRLLPQQCDRDTGWPGIILSTGHMPPRAMPLRTRPAPT